MHYNFKNRLHESRYQILFRKFINIFGDIRVYSLIYMEEGESFQNIHLYTHDLNISSRNKESFNVFYKVKNITN